MTRGERWAGRRCVAGQRCRREEGQSNAEVEGAARTDGSLHNLLPRVAARVQHARTDLGLQRVDLRVEVDSCQAAVERLQAGGGEMRALHERPQVLDAGAKHALDERQSEQFG